MYFADADDHHVGCGWRVSPHDPARAGTPKVLEVPDHWHLPRMIHVGQLDCTVVAQLHVGQTAHQPSRLARGTLSVFNLERDLLRQRAGLDKLHMERCSSL